MTPLRTPKDLREYQRRACTHVLNHLRAMLWLDMGLGKTVVTLTAIAHLLDCFEIRAVLIVAPLRVIQTVWKQEGASWSHTQHLEFSIIHGSKATRERSLRRRAHVYLVNYEGLPTLCQDIERIYLSKGRPLPFDMIVFDEITKVKSARIVQGSKRMQPVLKTLLPHIHRRTGLTGTPLPNGYTDLFGQYLVLDDGQRLGRSFSGYCNNWFMLRPDNQYKLLVTERGRKDIHTLISDITLEMNKKDYLQLPPVMLNVVNVELPDKVLKKYKKLEKEFFVELDQHKEIEVFNKAGLGNKCLQFCNGAVYYGEAGTGDWEELHTEKLDALEEIFEESGSPILTGTLFRHDAARIAARFKDKVVTLDHTVKGKDIDQIMQRWNAGEIPMLQGNPASVGHGLNLQYGSHTEVFFGLPWSWELYSQFYARVLERQGATRPGIVHWILASNTMDQVVAKAIQSKQTEESDLRQAVQEYRRQVYG